MLSAVVGIGLAIALLIKGGHVEKAAGHSMSE
jgi:hypothetical protein